MTAVPDMKDIVALCKRRGFVFAASDIYGGINGFWDFGPLGTELKNNLRDLWWRRMVLCPPIGPAGTAYADMPVEIVGVDTAIIQNPKVWIASGHAAGFNDPMVDCKETHGRYRADHLKVYKSDGVIWPAFYNVEDQTEITKRLKKLKLSENSADYKIVSYDQVPESDYIKIIGPDASKPGTLTAPRQFSMMLDTYPGVIREEENKAYLRPETAQGIFINFKNILDSTRVRVPFGVA
jgi:glycyl-tRNA synthetase